jgi:hypothetical protein
MFDGLIYSLLAGHVGGLDGAADLHGDAQHLGHGNALGAVALAQRGRAHLHYEVRPPVARDAGLVHREDGRVRAELGHEVRLGLEHLAHVIVDHLGEHHLHRDLPPRHVLLVEEDVGEAARAEHVDVGEAGQSGRLRRQSTRHGIPPTSRTISPL